MTLVFPVAGPISVNRAYGRGKTHKRLFLTRDGKRFTDALRAAALAARAGSDWPADPWRVAKARVGYQLVNYRGDTDGPRKLVKDAFEGVLYVNDRIVEDGPAPLPVKDPGARRIVIIVELLAWRSVEEAQYLRAAAESRAQRPTRRRRASLPAAVLRALAHPERTRA